MEENEIEVTLYYAKNVKVTVKYVEETTGNLLGQEIIKTKQGDQVEAKAKDFDEYVLIDRNSIIKINFA